MTAAASVLGVDYGSVRIGVAVSDAGRHIASPLATYTRRTPAQDAQFFQALVQDEDIGQIVVGLPVHMSGAEGQKARQARAFGKWLGEVTKRPVVFYDERLTTLEAEGFLLAAGLTNKRRKQRRDRVAAQILLQTYLDAGCPAEDAPRALEE